MATDSRIVRTGPLMVALAALACIALALPQAASAQRTRPAPTEGEAVADRLRETAATDSAAAEREALALIAAAEAGDGLGTDYARDIGDALRSIYADQRRDADRLALLERFRRSNQARYGPYDDRTLDWVMRLAHDLSALERYDEAEPWFMVNYEARRQRNANPTDDSQYELLEAARWLAHHHETLQRWADARVYWQEVIALSTAREGASHRHTLEWMERLATNYASAGQSDEQVALLRRMVELAEVGTNDDDGFYANQYRRHLADALAATGRRDEAQGIVATAAEYDNANAEDIYDRLSDDQQRALLMTAGRTDEVERLLMADMAMLEQSGRPELLTIGYEQFALFYDQTAQYARSEPYWRRYIAAQDADDDPYFHGAREGFARSLAQQGRYAEAEREWREVIRLYRDPDNGDPFQSHLYIAQLAALAEVLFNQGRAREAEELLINALGRGQHDDFVKSARETLGRIYARQGRNEEALVIYRRLRDQSARLGGDWAVATRLYDAQIAELVAGGVAAPAVIRIYEENADAFAATFGDNDPRTRDVVRRLAELYSDAGRLADAQALLDRQSADLSVRDAATFRLRHHLATLRWRQGDGRTALDQLTTLSADARAALGATSPAARHYTASAAELAMQEARYDRALPLARDVAAALDDVRVASSEQVTGDTQLDGLTDAAEGGYTLLADAAWSASDGDPALRSVLTGEAFAALQNAMTSRTDRAIARSVARRLADEEGGPLAELIRRIESVQTQRDALTRFITDSFASNAEATVALRATRARERDALSAEFATLDAELRRRYPDYYALVRADPVAADGVQRILTDDEALMIIVPGSRGTHVMTLVGGQLTWHRSALDQDAVDRLVSRMLYFLGAQTNLTLDDVVDLQSTIPGGVNGFDFASAWQLYQELLGPAMARLDSVDRLIVAAGGALGSLPLSVLVSAPPLADGPPAPQDFRNTPWLSDRFAIVQVPSVQSFALLRARRDAATRPARQFLGFGDPLLDGPPAARGQRNGTGAPGTRNAAGSGIAVNQLRRLARLPGTATELQAMAGLFGADGRVLLEAASTETNVKAMDLTGVDVLSFATHALTVDEIDGAAEPGLVMTPPASPSGRDDGYLSASEVSQLRLSADWVILSACNTASSDGRAGSRGLSGLARAFFYAGAGNILASHWPVRDDVAAALTVRTIAIARANPDLSRAAAFQQALAEIRRIDGHDGLVAGVQQSWAHPSAWAPFTLIGDGR